MNIQENVNKVVVFLFLSISGILFNLAILKDTIDIVVYSQMTTFGMLSLRV